jgi:glycosyltransferase involved in cell wall biosynthesis
LPLRVCMTGAFAADYPRHQIIRAGLERVGVEVVSAALPRGVSTTRLIVPLLRQWQTLRRCDVIFITAFNALLAPIIWALGHSLRKPVVLDYMVGLTDGIVEERHEGGGKAQFYRLVDRFNIQRLTSLTDTQAHRAAYQRLLGIAPTKMSVLPVGVYDEWFNPKPLPAGESILVQFFGTYIPFHGVDVILEAAHRLRDEAHIRFELIGRGQSYKAAVARAEALNLQNVSFIDPVPPAALPDRVAQAAICLGVFGAREKTAYVVPNKVFQCMAIGRPVVTADSPALHECFSPGHDLVTVAPGNAAALAESIRALAESPERRTELGSAAAQRIHEAYLPQHIGARLKAVLERVISPSLHGGEGAGGRG